MTYETAVKEASIIAKRVSQVAYVHVLGKDYNFRFTQPIESVPGVGAKTVARIDPNGTLTNVTWDSNSARLQFGGTVGS